MALTQLKLKRVKIYHYIHTKSKRYCDVFPSEPSFDFDLSMDVLHHIFSFLPIKQAVQLGILNTVLKNSWLFNRNFCFGREFAKLHRRRDKIVKIINRVFSLHCGSVIRCFQLYINPVYLDSTVESWTSKSIAKGVEELDLDFSNGSDRLKLSTDLINIVTLKILKLSSCEILQFPMKFNGLSLLRILTLRSVNITKNSIMNVFQNCLNLEVLELAKCTKIHELEIFTEKLKKFKVLKVRECSNIIQIHINSPTLCSFHYYGHVRGIYFTSITTSEMKDVMINYIPAQGFVRQYHMRDLVLNFDCVQVLTITGTFIELGNFDFECGDLWEIHLKQKFMESIALFHHLKLIKVKNFKYQKHVLELASYCLKGAVYLETLALVTPRHCPTKFDAQYAKNYEQFLYFWRVSPIARIFITDHANDMCCTQAKHPKRWY